MAINLILDFEIQILVFETGVLINLVSGAFDFRFYFCYPFPGAPDKSKCFRRLANQAMSRCRGVGHDIT